MTPLFVVAADVDRADALIQASDVLDCIERLSLTVATETGKGGEKFAVHYLAQMAKALVDACISEAEL